MSKSKEKAPANANALENAAAGEGTEAGSEVASFADNKGLPSNAHAKKLAKEKAKRHAENVGVEYEKFYTKKGDKILLVTVKHNGAYSSYVDNYKKKEAAFKPLIKKWAAEGKFVAEHEYEDFVAEAVVRARAVHAKREAAKDEKKKLRSKA